jgi:hypothetical protein
MTSGHKRAQDVVRQVDEGSNTGERENKRSRHSEDYQTSSQFHPSPENPPLSTLNDHPSDVTTVENYMSQHDIISALDLISRTIAVRSSPEPTFSGPSSPTTSSANAELQRQLVQTWDVKRVQELEHQGK